QAGRADRGHARAGQQLPQAAAGHLRLQAACPQAHGRPDGAGRRARLRTMPQQEIIAILLSELEEAAAPLAAAFSGIAAAADGSQALRDAIAAASAQVDCIRAAAEAGGLLGLEVIGDRLRDNRSEEHTSELQSRENLVCRLLLEKKKNIH